MKAHKIRVTGRVQGVFFRAETQRKASELGIAGWVRNREDGSVEIHAEGSDAALKKLDEWCHEGPPAAEVESVDIHESEPEGCTEFLVVH